MLPFLAQDSRAEIVSLQRSYRSCAGLALHRTGQAHAQNSSQAEYRQVPGPRIPGPLGLCFGKTAFDSAAPRYLRARRAPLPPRLNRRFGGVARLFVGRVELVGA